MIGLTAKIETDAGKLETLAETLENMVLRLNPDNFQRDRVEKVLNTTLTIQDEIQILIRDIEEISKALE